MSSIAHIAFLIAIAAGGILPAGSLAQHTTNHDHMDQTHAPVMTQGEVRKIDLDAGTITLKHADIKHLDMPGMTMVFKVRDKALLAGLKPGARVEFMTVREGGKHVITEMRPAR